MKEGKFFSNADMPPLINLDENKKITEVPFPKSSAESLKKDPLAKEILAPELLPFEGDASDEVLSPENRGLLKLDESKEITTIPFGKSAARPLKNTPERPATANKKKTIFSQS